MLKLLRSSSPLMTHIRVGAAVIVVVLYCCCNAEKRVLKDPGKTANVVNKYLLTHHFESDTVTTFIEGDTITKLLIGYDTTFLPGDVITKRDTIKIREVVYKTVNKTDTLKIRIADKDLLKACQDQLTGATFKSGQSAVDLQVVKVQLKQWKFYFWALVAAILGITGLYIFFARK